jgi:C4-type Zn-finger protein
MSEETRIVTVRVNQTQEANMKCPLCAVGDKPFKMKRQFVHHIPATGQIVVCTDATLKPSA